MLAYCRFANEPRGNNCFPTHRTWRWTCWITFSHSIPTVVSRSKKLWSIRILLNTTIHLTNPQLHIRLHSTWNSTIYLYHNWKNWSSKKRRSSMNYCPTSNENKIAVSCVDVSQFVVVVWFVFKEKRIVRIDFISFDPSSLPLVTEQQIRPR